MNKNELALFTKISEALERLNIVLEYPDVHHKKDFRVTHHAQGLDNVEMDYTPSPLSSKPIRTQSQAIEDILYHSGQMARDSWEALKGFEYDADVTDNEDAAFRDSEVSEEFQQSSLASYYSHNVPQVDVPTEPQGSHQTSVVQSSSNGDATQSPPSEGVNNE